MYTMETKRVGFVLLCVFDTRSKHNNRSMLRRNPILSYIVYILCKMPIRL